MMYEITQDCRIANKDYEKGQLVSKEEVGGRFPSVMKEVERSSEEKKEGKTPVKKAKKPDPEVEETPEEGQSESENQD